MNSTDEQQRRAKGGFLQRLASIVFMLPAWFAPHCRLRVFFHRLRGVKIGRNVEIGYFCILDNVHPSLVTIEDDAVVTARVTILAHDNAYYYTHGGQVTIGETRIGRNAFIGVGAVVLPKLTIGDSAIVGANSVVTKDVAAGAIVGGIPARTLKPGVSRDGDSQEKEENAA